MTSDQLREMNETVRDSWVSIGELDDPHTVHVIPLRDAVEHEDIGGDCICGPTAEYLGEARDGADAWLVTHHSLDGREAGEQRQAWKDAGG